MLICTRMRQIIDIDEEQSKLWARVYADLRILLQKVATPTMPYTSNSFPHQIKSVFVDKDGVILVNTSYGMTNLIEDLPDEAMYSIYKVLTSHL